MNPMKVGEAVEAARRDAGLSQRALADRTGISQSTLSRIIAGDRVAKLPELIRIADKTGYPVALLTGSTVEPRVQCAARATNGADMTAMRNSLLYFIELDAYLDEYAIPVVW